MSPVEPPLTEPVSLNGVGEAEKEYYSSPELDRMTKADLVKNPSKLMAAMKSLTKIKNTP